MSMIFATISRINTELPLLDTIIQEMGKATNNLTVTKAI
jgi:hypothetical protein